METKERIYARPNGEHYHLRYCIMLLNGDFEKWGYVEITPDDIKRRSLKRCSCTANLKVR